LPVVVHTGGKAN